MEVSAIRSGQRARAAKNCAAVMKNLLLIAGLGVLGYLGYQEWFAKPEPEPVAVAAPQPTDPWLRTKVTRLLDEWKRRNAGTEKKQYALRTDMGTILSEIKMRGPHTEIAIKAAFGKALVELGVDSQEVAEVVKGIWNEADRDGKKGGHNRTSELGQSAGGQ